MLPTTKRKDQENRQRSREKGRRRRSVMPACVGMILLSSFTSSAAFQRPSRSPSAPGRPSLPFTSRLLESNSPPLASPPSPQAPQTNDDYSSNSLTSSSIPAPFRMMFDEEKDWFAFQTATIQLRKPSEGQEVRLVGSVHIAEPTYFASLDQACDGCDLVLHEMITSQQNVIKENKVVNDNDQGKIPRIWHREKLGVELAATPELRQMALMHGLVPQLDRMDFYHKDNWYLSDISREALTDLQRARGERSLDATANSIPGLRHLGELAQIFWEGFTSRGKVLPKFLFMKGNLSTFPFRFLRLVMWLTPAPELQLLLLDWARQYPPAGGFSKILRSMVGAVVHGDVLTLRRLAFSQMLTSSQGAPPPEVLVLERNSKVVLDIEEALKAGAKKIGILYGGLHLKDIEEKLSRHLNFTRQGMEWQTAWTMPAYTAHRQGIVALLCVTLPLLYLGVGAADWSATFGGLSQQIAEGLDVGKLPVSVGFQDIVLYLLRHMYMYYGLTRWIVEWEKQLFDGSGALEGKEKG